MTDYTTLSGAEFQREVGDDPEKWAEAFDQAVRSRDGNAPNGHDERIAFWLPWFRDAMDAARKAKPPPPTE
jgi:hypothetical protein